MKIHLKLKGGIEMTVTNISRMIHVIVIIWTEMISLLLSSRDFWSANADGRSSMNKQLPERYSPVLIEIEWDEIIFLTKFPFCVLFIAFEICTLNYHLNEQLNWMRLVHPLVISFRLHRQSGWWQKRCHQGGFSLPPMLMAMLTGNECCLRPSS